MRKQTALFFLLIVMLLSFAFVTAYAAEDSGEWDNLTWEFDQQGVLTISGVGPMKEGYQEGSWDERTYPWTKYKYDIKSVIINEGLTNVAYAAFSNSSLEKVQFPNTLKSIDYAAFNFCERLNSINIPEGTEKIDIRSFYGCSSVESISLPSTLKTLAGFGSLGPSSVLKEINLAEGNGFFTLLDGALFSSDLSVMYVFPALTKGEYTIPSSVSLIKSDCFAYSNLSKLIIPDTVKEIENFAFEMSHITDVEMYCSKAKLGESLFDRSTVSHVALADGLKSISRMMFSECKKLVDVTIPASVTSIGDSAFAGCQSLSDILVPKSVTKIGPSAFAFDTTIHCIAKSSAQKWAEQNGLKYEIYKPVTKITFDTNMITPAIGTTMQLTPGFVPEDASNTNVVWSSDNPDIATVSEDGVVSAVANGKCKINAVAADGSGVKATINVSVIAPVGAVTLDQTEVTINKGKSLKLNAEVGPAEATNKKVTWSTSDASIATVNNGSVSAKACGECDIICEAADGSGVKSVCHVNVIQMVTSLTAKPPKLTIPYGGTSSEVEVKIVPEVVTNPVLVWSSSDESICSVDENGVITAVGAGDCEISCTTTDGSNKSVTVKVHVPVFSETELQLSVTEKGETLLPIDLHGASPADFSIKSNVDNLCLYYLDETGLHIYPIATGSGQLTVTSTIDKSDTITCIITVDDTALLTENDPLTAYVVAPTYIVPGENCNVRYYVGGGVQPYTSCTVKLESILFDLVDRTFVKPYTALLEIVNTFPSGSVNFNESNGGIFDGIRKPSIHVTDSTNASCKVYGNEVHYLNPKVRLKTDYTAVIKGQPITYDIAVDGVSGNYKLEMWFTPTLDNVMLPQTEQIANIGKDATVTLDIPVCDTMQIIFFVYDKKQKLVAGYLESNVFISTEDTSIKFNMENPHLFAGSENNVTIEVEGNVPTIEEAFFTAYKLTDDFEEIACYSETLESLKFENDRLTVGCVVPDADFLRFTMKTTEYGSFMHDWVIIK